MKPHALKLDILGKYYSYRRVINMVIVRISPRISPGITVLLLLLIQALGLLGI